MPRIRRLSAVHADKLANWPTVDPAVVPARVRNAFERRRQAVFLYLRGASVAQIAQETGIDRSQVLKLAQLATTPQADGSILGDAALIPYQKRTAQRKLPPPDGPLAQGFAGAFQQLLARHPCIRTAMETVLTSTEGVLRPGSAEDLAGEVVATFHEACREVGLTWDDYPFNTDTLARQSVRKFTKDYIAAHPEKTVKNVYGHDAAVRMHTGSGRGKPVVAVFERAEADAHKLDVNCTVLVRHPNGQYVPRRLRRMWIIVLIEVRSRAVLGYCLSLGREPCKQDLLDALHMALSPWQPCNWFDPHLPYSVHAGFPSVHPNYLHLGFRELSVDKALMNISSDVSDRLRQLMDARVMNVDQERQVSGRSNPNDRPYIEGFFRLIEERGFHKLRATTGSHPRDPKRAREIDVRTGRHALDVQHLPALLDHVISEYNGAPHGGLGDISPLDFLAQMAAQIHPQCRTLEQQDIDTLQFVVVTRQVRGNIEEGRPPYVDYIYGHYTGGPLAFAYALIGQTVQLRVNVQDARFGQLFSMRGEFLGSVHANPPWDEIPHSLRLRSLICKARNGRLRHELDAPNPLRAYAKLIEQNVALGGPVLDGYLRLQRSIILGAGPTGHVACGQGDQGAPREVKRDLPPLLPAVQGGRDGSN
ncbi:MAG: hypothetical protein JO067_04215 [Cupriavidus sp.]|nr:hypothetical protein [Cupriavidus sp.]